MAKNRNEPQDDQSLEALLFAQNKQQQDQHAANSKTKAKELENQKEIVKNIKAVYTPVSKSQTSLVELNKNITQYNKIIQSEISKNSELLKQNISNTKSLYDLLEKTFDPSKKQQVTSGKNKKEGKANNDNFENKARHEQGILGADDHITPLLSSINNNTAEILKLLKAKPKNDDDKPPKPSDSPWNLPGMPKFMNWVIPAVVAAVAMRHSEVGTGAKAALGVTTAAVRVGAPIVEAARVGASAASGASKLSAATEAARQAMTLANLKAAMQGPAKVGMMGKVGAGLGAGATVGRAMEGDYAGATAQGISTLLPLILSKTKYGKMAALASAGIDVGLVGRDYINYQDKKEAAAAEGKTIKSPIEQFTDDIKTLGAMVGIGDGPDKTAEAIDPVVQNTSETNKILTDIRDGKGGSGSAGATAGGGIFAGSTGMVGTAVVGGLLAHRFGLLNKLAGGVASSGLGARVGAGLSGLGSSIGANAGRVGAAGLSAAGTVGKKALGKLIPGVGLVMGATGAYDKIKEGDWTGAALEGGSGIASLFPGIGTAVAIGLQGISATRDAIKETNKTTTDGITATNAAQTASIAKAAGETNKQVVSSSDALTASIAAGAANANKQITDTSKTANDSLTKSATTLTNTSTSLSDILIKSSTTLLGMIGKMTPAGMGQAAYNFFSGGPTANENARSYGNEMNKNRAGNQMMVYKSFLNAGMSPQQAKIFTAEIGRENSYNPNEMFGSHTDDKNGLTNVGMLSWQKDRADKFMKFMKANGQIDANGKIKWGQGSLDAQARFIKEELAGSYYNKAGSKFLNDKNISYADGAKLLGKNYIGWRYDDPKYANGHDRRDRYYATLNEQLRNGTPIQPHTPTSDSKKVSYISKAAMDKLSKAAPKPATPLGPDALKKWEASEKARVAELQKTQKGILAGSIVVGTPPKEQKVSKTNTQPKRDAENKNFDKVDNKEFYALGQKNVVVQNGVDMSGLQPNVRTQFYTMVGELFATKGAKGKVVVTSAYRSPASQQALWNKKLKENGGDEAKTRKFVAPPGTSNHEKGLALDLDTKGSNNVALLDSSGLLSKYGFSRPMSHEPWHIEYGSGKAGAATTSTAGDPSAEDGPIDVGQVFSEGLAAVINSDAMNSVREFMKGSIDKPVDKYGKPTAMGTFTKDESDPTRTKPKDSGNGDMWENLDQQLGDGTLSRQERNQSEYEKVRKAFGGDGSIKRQERDQKEYDKVKKAFGGSNAIFRQIGGKYGWLADVFGGLFGGDDTLLGSLFGILTGSQDIAGLPKVLGKAIVGNNSPLEAQGAFGGGFGGGLAQNNSEATGVYEGDLPSGAVNGGFGGGRVVSYNEDGTIAGIERTEDSQLGPVLSPDVAEGGFTKDSSDGLPGGMRLPSFGGGIDLSTAMGGFGGGIAGGLGYDDTFTRYENSEFDQAKQYHQQAEESKMQVQVNIPEPVETPTQQAPSGGKSSQPGLGGGQIFTRNPDSIIQQVALAMMRSSV